VDDDTRKATNITATIVERVGELAKSYGIEVREIE